ncbi:MAG: SET domain-containing protein-lysine N-methyltransferase [Terrimonas sp.]|nr:SET domain-containing protein-lysine N-methyltransferase [Terrimonas sp.]
MILPCIYIAPAGTMGRGVFTSRDIEKDTAVELSPVIVMSAKERELLDQTLLHDYIFEWGPGKEKCGMALGYIAVYNHAYYANCEYEMDYDQALIKVKAVRFINRGEQLFINYNGNWDDQKPLWFDAQ